MSEAKKDLQAVRLSKASLTNSETDLSFTKTIKKQHFTREKRYSHRVSCCFIILKKLAKPYGTRVCKEKVKAR